MGRSGTAPPVRPTAKFSESQHFRKTALKFTDGLGSAPNLAWTFPWGQDTPVTRNGPPGHGVGGPRSLIAKTGLRACRNGRTTYVGHVSEKSCSTETVDWHRHLSGCPAARFLRLPQAVRTISRSREGDFSAWYLPTVTDPTVPRKVAPARGSRPAFGSRLRPASAAALCAVRGPCLTDVRGSSAEARSGRFYEGGVRVRFPCGRRRGKRVLRRSASVESAEGLRSLRVLRRCVSRTFSLRSRPARAVLLRARFGHQLRPLNASCAHATVHVREGRA